MKRSLCSSMATVFSCIARRYRSIPDGFAHGAQLARHVGSDRRVDDLRDPLRLVGRRSFAQLRRRAREGGGPERWRDVAPVALGELVDVSLVDEEVANG